jgi:hypothetical protein
VENFNRKLLKFMKPFGHVKVIKVESNREYFTRHGLHMNNEGKEEVIRKVANIITMFQKHIEEPIRLRWKTEHNERANLNLYGENRIGQKGKKVTTTENEDNIGCEEYQKMTIEEGSKVINCRTQTSRTSCRQNKANIMRSKDLLWQK